MDLNDYFDIYASDEYVEYMSYMPSCKPILGAFESYYYKHKLVFKVSLNKPLIVWQVRHVDDTGGEHSNSFPSFVMSNGIITKRRWIKDGHLYSDDESPHSIIHSNTMYTKEWRYKDKELYRKGYGIVKLEYKNGTLTHRVTALDGKEHTIDEDVPSHMHNSTTVFKRTWKHNGKFVPLKSGKANSIFIAKNSNTTVMSWYNTTPDNCDILHREDGPAEIILSKGVPDYVVWSINGKEYNNIDDFLKDSQAKESDIIYNYLKYGISRP